ncbi:hypothetical protein PIROE2DRAFT_18458, partial [Piromyces sp. E2]
MTYGETFQDKQLIEDYMTSNITFLNEFREYLKERVQLEKKYAKESADLVQKYSQKFEKKSRQSICITSPNGLGLNTNSVADVSSLNTITENSDPSPTTPTSPQDVNKDYYTYINAWRSILNQMKSVNESRNKFSQKLSDIIIEKLKAIINIREDERKI